MLLSSHDSFVLKYIQNKIRVFSEILLLATIWGQDVKNFSG